MKKVSFLFLVWLLSSSLAYLPTSSFKTKIGDQVPSFKMTTLEDKKLQIEDLQGKVILLAFFGTKCPPCLKELPEIEKELTSQYQKDKFEVIAIGPLDNKESLLKFQAKKDYPFTFVPDQGKRIFDLFADSSIPRTVLLDTNGKILYQARGFYPSPFKRLVKLVKEEVASL